MPDDGCDSELLKLGTDKSLFDDAGFLPFAQKYKGSQDAFFEDYKKVLLVYSTDTGRFIPFCVSDAPHLRRSF